MWIEFPALRCVVVAEVPFRRKRSVERVAEMVLQARVWVGGWLVRRRHSEGYRGGARKGKRWGGGQGENADTETAAVEGRGGRGVHQQWRETRAVRLLPYMYRGPSKGLVQFSALLLLIVSWHFGQQEVRVGFTSPAYRISTKGKASRRNCLRVAGR